MTQIIATRKLTFGGQSPRAVFLNVYEPERLGDDHICRYEIHWPDGIRGGRGVGVDQIQALLSALRKLGVDVYCSEAAKSGELVWLEKGNGYGLPLPTEIRELSRGDDVNI